MAGLLTSGWCAAVVGAGAGLDPWDGATVSFAIEVSGAPDGKRRGQLAFEDGRIVVCDTARGAAADCAVECAHADALTMLAGTLNADVAFMTGRLKVDGSYERVIFGLHEWWRSSSMRSFRDAVAALTTAD